jgi:hypothetical protein
VSAVSCARGRRRKEIDDYIATRPSHAAAVKTDETQRRFEPAGVRNRLLARSRLDGVIIDVNLWTMTSR